MVYTNIITLLIGMTMPSQSQRNTRMNMCSQGSEGLMMKVVLGIILKNQSSGLTGVRQVRMVMA